MALSADLYTVIENPSMAARTSIRLGGEAIAEVRVHSAEGIEQLPGLAARIGGQVRIIGEGTNVIAASGKLPFLLVNYDRHTDPTILGEKDGRVLARVDAGMRLPGLLAWAARRGLCGMEGLAGIPGSVGGAIAMNAGSFGVETGGFLRSAQIFSPSLGLVEREAEDLEFAYRSCRLAGPDMRFLVTAATFAFYRDETDAIRTRIRDFYIKKQASQPVASKSAGCVFKNPAPDKPAGRLLDEAGLKGRKVGGMYFSTLHANFMVNDGQGSFEQAMELISIAREKVLEKSGLQLELEVQIWR